MSKKQIAEIEYLDPDDEAERPVEIEVVLPEAPSLEEPIKAIASTIDAAARETHSGLAELARALAKSGVGAEIAQLGAIIESAARTLPLSLDLAAVARAVDRNTDALQDLVDVLGAPKRIIFSDEDKTLPIGIHIARPN